MWTENQNLTNYEQDTGATSPDEYHQLNLAVHQTHHGDQSNQVSHDGFDHLAHPEFLFQEQQHSLHDLSGEGLVASYTENGLNFDVHNAQGPDFTSPMMNSSSGHDHHVNANVNTLEDDFTPLLSPAISSHHGSAAVAAASADNFEMPPAVLDLMPEPYDFENRTPKSSAWKSHQPNTSANRVSKPSPSIKPLKYGSISDESQDYAMDQRSQRDSRGQPPGSGSLRMQHFSGPESSSHMSLDLGPSMIINDGFSQSDQQQLASNKGPVTPSMLMNLQRSSSTGHIATATEERLRTALQATVSMASKQPLRKKSTSKARSTSSSPAIIPKHPLISPSIRPRPGLRTSMSSSSRPKIVMPSPGISPMIGPMRSSSQPQSQSQSQSQLHSPSHTSPQDGRRSSRTSPNDNIDPRERTLSLSSSTGMNDNDDISNALASKSNYQHILEGTHSKIGLSYPETLSAELSSKKTNHKLAEQERRNRINSALQDLSALISTSSKPEKSTPSSKADIVESAIAHIRGLNKQLEDLKRENEALRAKQ